MTYRIAFHNEVLWYSAWFDINSGILRSPQIGDIVITDLANDNLSVADIKKFQWFIDLKPEGINSEDLKYLYEFLTSCGVGANNFRVAFSCVEDVSNLPYPAISITNRLIHNGNWFENLQSQRINWQSLSMTHKFVCLMRRPSIGRAHLTKRLYTHFDKKDMVLTFGTSGSRTSKEIENLVHPRPVPIVVDHPDVDRVVQHKITHDLFYRAPINLIVESSSQIDPGVWRSVFVTEKSFKALAWHQFPLWYAVPGLVAEVRRQGYDVFDDIFENHYYDDIQDPWFRMTQVILLLKRVCKQDLLALRKQHWDRLDANSIRIAEVHRQTKLSHGNMINELLARE